VISCTGDFVTSWRSSGVLLVGGAAATEKIDAAARLGFRGGGTGALQLGFRGGRRE
jgi:hypothetical protein